MEKEFKPTGYNSLSPYLIVDGAQKMINFLKQVFQATELRRYDMPDGSIMHAEMKLDDSVIMLGDASEKYPSVPSVLHVYVHQVDEVFERAVKAGAISVEAPKQNGGDPDKRGTFTDFAGNMWSVSTQV